MVGARTDDDKGTRSGNRPSTTAAHEARPANGWFIPTYAVQ